MLTMENQEDEERLTKKLLETQIGKEEMNFRYATSVLSTVDNVLEFVLSRR